METKNMNKGVCSASSKEKRACRKCGILIPHGKLCDDCLAELFDALLDE